MTYLLLALGVFFVIDLVLFWVEAPPQWVRVTQGLLGVGAVLLIGQTRHWYLGFGVAGGALLLARFADFLLLRKDDIRRR
jgi:hypothetical protein